VTQKKKQHLNTKEPYKFRLVDGVWQRRRVAGGRWETFKSSRIAADPLPEGKRDHMTQPPTTIWSWE
jgi:hypothetical protein